MKLKRFKKPFWGQAVIKPTLFHERPNCLYYCKAPLWPRIPSFWHHHHNISTPSFLGAVAIWCAVKERAGIAVCANIALYKSFFLIPARHGNVLSGWKEPLMGMIWLLFWFGALISMMLKRWMDFLFLPEKSSMDFFSSAQWTKVSSCLKGWMWDYKSNWTTPVVLIPLKADTHRWINPSWNTKIVWTEFVQSHLLHHSCVRFRYEQNGAI